MSDAGSGGHKAGQAPKRQNHRDGDASAFGDALPKPVSELC